MFQEKVFKTYKNFGTPWQLAHTRLWNGIALPVRRNSCNSVLSRGTGALPSTSNIDKGKTLKFKVTQRNIDVRRRQTAIVARFEDSIMLGHGFWDMFSTEEYVKCDKHTHKNTTAQQPVTSREHFLAQRFKTHFTKIDKKDIMDLLNCLDLTSALTGIGDFLPFCILGFFVSGDDIVLLLTKDWFTDFDFTVITKPSSSRNV
ncbi:hypothetical protein GQX74_005859 [Glossina fuscipes]|nr:hypothetical protein GQX74_005859 [Glossina fuscipes]